MVLEGCVVDIVVATVDDRVVVSLGIVLGWMATDGPSAMLLLLPWRNVLFAGCVVETVATVAVTVGVELVVSVLVLG